MTTVPVPTGARPWRVVVIDDSPDDRAEIRRLLLKGSERRYQFVEAETGAAGVRAVLDAADPPDCVVLDYNLPDMDAVEVLAALAGPGGRTVCPVVVLTGTVGHEHIRAVLRAGAQDYLGKGWMTPESLTRAVENSAERWAMGGELRDRGVALRESEARLGGILRLSPAGIVQTDAGGCMTLVNPRFCQMLGYDNLELLGESILKITHPSTVAPTAAAFGRLAAGGPDFQIEEAYSRKDGAVLRALSNVAAIRSPGGEFLGLIAVVLDISERLRSDEELRRLAAELSEADRRKDVFLATLAHELRNPLAPIRNGLELMKLARNNGDAVENVRAMMDRQLTQLVRLVDDLLDVSRITQGKVELRRERVDLKAVIEAAVETSRPALEQAGHKLAVVVPDEPIFVDGDATRLAQVVSNLLHNSAKYTHRGGHVRLTVGREGETAVVSVEDNGIGIPPAMLDNVFVMFTQVDRTLEKTTGGLGIGLSLVKGLLEMHGGTIEARSDGEGMGSEFVVRLPVVMGVVAKPERPEALTSEVTPSALRRILVVDDNVDSAESLRQLLEMLGNEVRTATDGEAGIEVAAQFRPDVVLMDIGMPKLNGYEAARRIRQHPWSRGMVLVAVTGWGQDGDRKHSANAGFDHHLVKPVELDTLTTLMSSLDSADTGVATPAPTHRSNPAGTTTQIHPPVDSSRPPPAATPSAAQRDRPHTP